MEPAEVSYLGSVWDSAVENAELSIVGESLEILKSSWLIGRVVDQGNRNTLIRSHHVVSCEIKRDLVVLDSEGSNVFSSLRAGIWVGSWTDIPGVSVTGDGRAIIRDTVWVSLGESYGNQAGNDDDSEFHWTGVCLCNKLVVFNNFYFILFYFYWKDLISRCVFEVKFWHEKTLI